MGLLFCAFTEKYTRFYNSEILSYFGKMRGDNHRTGYKVDSMPVESAMYPLKSLLPKSEYNNYKPWTFVHGVHSLNINDGTMNGSQPFEYPDEFLQRQRFQKTKKREHISPCKLMCKGEIYNYQDLITNNEIDTEMFTSNTDSEIIYGLYSKYGIDYTVNSLNGRYAFILSENTCSYKLSEINIYVARNILGISPLFITSTKDQEFYMFTSWDPSEHFIFTQEDMSISEFPKGNYWSFQTRTFTEFSNIETILNNAEITYNRADPDTLNHLYDNIKSTLIQAVKHRIYTSTGSELDVPPVLLFSGGFNSCLLFYIMLSLRISKINLVCIHGSALISIINTFETQFPDTEIKTHLIHPDISTETFTEHSVIPIEAMYRYINSHLHDTKVILCGFGLNELFKSTSRYSDIVDTTETFNISELKEIEIYTKYSYIYNLQTRFPFLDTDWVTLVYSINEKLKRPQVYAEKRRINKFLIRKAFDCPETSLWLWTQPQRLVANTIP
jgi:asparagine synthase (glutamine-hydrolysing)